MLAQTVERVTGFVPRENIFVITTQTQLAGVHAACPELSVENFVAEPMGRDTAMATGLATLLVKERSPQATFAMLPSDHVIHNVTNYQRLLDTAFSAAESSDVLVTIGIKPSEPATGFGYIHRGSVWKHIAGTEVFTVQRFVEKPDRAIAEKYFETGEYYWNAGMFVWRVPVVEAGLKRHFPELHATLIGLEANVKKEGWGKALAKLYPSLKKISVDYALMEKSTNVVVLPATCYWDDVGAWPAIANYFSADEAGNVLRGLAMVESGANNIVVSSAGHLAAIVGANGLVVVHTPDATLVCPKDKAQEIKKLLRRLGEHEELKKFL